MSTLLEPFVKALEQARAEGIAEGRQQAVREVYSALMATHEPDTGSHHFCGPFPEDCHGIHAILDRVAVVES